MKPAGWITRLVIATCCFIVVFPAAASAPRDPTATFTVTKTADTNDGACAVDDCSLREAIGAANGSPGVDTITFDQGGSPKTYQITIPGAGEAANLSGDFDILENVIIDGEGQGFTVVDGGQLDRVFEIRLSQTVTMTGLTIRNGKTPDVDVLGGGGILGQGILVLDDVEITENQAKQGGGITNSLGQVYASNSKIWKNGDLTTFEGGGISSDGDLFIDSTQFLENIAIRGGGVSTSESDIFFEEVTFSGNVAVESGGAIYNDKNMWLKDSTFSNNQAESGAAIYNNFILYLDAVTIDNNQASLTGGGIYNDGELYLKNVTLSANSAEDSGGGIYNVETLELLQVTLALNNAPNGGSIYNGASGLITIANSIVSRNGALPNCLNAGSIISLGHNLEDFNTCSLRGTGDMRSTDPKLSPLSDNDGKTWTHALLTDSPAVETGGTIYCAQKDQRGVYRPVDGEKDGEPVCDIGAYELVTAGWVYFAPTVYNSTEGTVVTIWVYRIGSFEPVSVDYSAITAPLWNFLPVSGTLSWGLGDSAPKSFTLTILDDLYDEPLDLIELQLTHARYGVGIYPDGVASIFIPANDPGGLKPPSPALLPIIRK